MKFLFLLMVLGGLVACGKNSQNSNCYSTAMYNTEQVVTYNAMCSAYFETPTTYTTTQGTINAQAVILCNAFEGLIYQNQFYQAVPSKPDDWTSPLQLTLYSDDYYVTPAGDPSTYQCWWQVVGGQLNQSPSTPPNF